jgi:membrane-associated phospholipid phosphatase
VTQSAYVVVGLVLLLVLVGGAIVLARWLVSHRSVVLRPVVRLWLALLRTRPMRHLRERYPRSWRFVAARFAPGEYLGLHLTVGLAICLAALWLFAGITEDVVHQDPLTAFDLRVLAALHAGATPSGYALARAISALGSALIMAALALSVSVLLAVRRQAVLLEGWLIAFVGGGILNQALKRIVQRPRPLHSSILSSASWSFPSGHAMESLIGYGMLAYLLLLLPEARAWRPVVVIGAASLILAIGFTRLYLGVHYFSDVVGGYAAGGIWLSACISGLEITRRWRPPPLLKGEGVGG